MGEGLGGGGGGGGWQPAAPPNAGTCVVSTEGYMFMCHSSSHTYHLKISFLFVNGLRYSFDPHKHHIDKFACMRYKDYSYKPHTACTVVGGGGNDRGRGLLANH